jgi:iron complex outermembrane receptor protein
VALRNTYSARRGVSALAIAISALALPGAAFAQEAPAEEDSGEIVVTGFRASLESAVNKKKSSDQIVESISAEDIGKLPDASIAESIARLPGLTSQRLSGRSNSITIRGFAPDFSTTLLNGREQTSTGDNRAVEYDQYPSEMISQVNVYKTPMASLVGQGLSGTVDLRTIRPLAAGKTIFSVGARGTYADNGKLNAGSKDKGFRVNGLFVSQFKDDTIGLVLGASYVDESYQTKEFNAWGYPTDGGNAVIGGSKSYNTSSRLTRLGLNGTLEIKATPNLSSTFDAFYSDFKDDNIKRGIELPLAWSGASLSPTGLEISNGQVVSGTFSGVEGVVNNHNFVRQANLYSGGFNAAYEGEDGWNASFDVSFSKTDRTELIVESNAGTGPGSGVGATDTLTFVSGPNGTYFTSHLLDYSNPNTILLTDPLGWGGGAPGGRQHGYYNNRIVEDELWQYQVEIEKEFDGGFVKSVQFGMDYVNRDKSLVPDEYFLQLSGGLLSAQVPSQYLLAPTNLGYLGLGPMISYSPLALLEGGVYTRVANTGTDVLFKSFSVSEDLMTLFGQVNIEHEMGGATLTGNFGVQAINTNQKSTGYIKTPTTPELRTLGANYWDVLPSLNLSLRLESGLVFRFGLSREIQRPRLDDMRVNFSYGVNPTEQIVLGEGGNPALRPYRATAVDFNIEKYFGTKGYIAAQFFYKKLHNYIYTAETPFDFTGYPLNDPGYAFSYQGRIKQPVNGEGGEIYGVELAGTLPVGEFVPFLNGFGLTGGVSYTKSKIQPDPSSPASDIPGYSRWVANGTAYYETGGFSIRGSVRYRSTFLGDFSGFGAQRVRRRALSELIVDAQVGYDFQAGSALEGLSVFAQGLNLTNEPFVATNPGADLQVLNHQNYGRRFMAGFTYKF